MTARVIVDALSMLGVAAESFRHEGKPFLRAFFAPAHIAFTQTSSSKSLSRSKFICTAMTAPENTLKKDVGGEAAVLDASFLRRQTRDQTILTDRPQ